MTYKEIEKTLILNTKMKQGVDNKGTIRFFRISPNEGYKLHDKLRDWEEVNPETNETTLHKGYTEIIASCGADYDFKANPREFYAVPAKDVMG